MNFHVKVAGFYKFEAVKPDGTRRVLADWFPNVITDYGLNGLGSIPKQFVYCSVGTGNTTPAETDTGLATYLTHSGTITADSNGNQAAEPYYSWRRITWRFAAGTATGNISEVGIGQSTGGINLFSRALTKDALGNPTTISVLSDEVLDVTYECRMYPDLTDHVFTFDINGVTYSSTLRPYLVNSSTYWPGANIGNIHTLYQHAGLSVFVYGYLVLSNGSIQDVVTQLSGTTAGSNSGANSGWSASAYSNLSYQIDITCLLSLSQANLSGGITALAFGLGALGTYQFSASPAIPKNSTNNLSLTMRFSWSRL